MYNAIYNMANLADLATDRNWMGDRLDAVQLHGGTANWQDWLSSIGWQADMFASQDLQIFWSIPLIPDGATLKSAAAGNYTSNYVAMAKQLAAASAADDKIYVRLGWEFNGDNWNSSSAVGEPDNYIKAFRDFVTAARTVSDKFVFEWAPALGTHDMNPELAYPGDAYVDIVGVDMYYDVRWNSTDAAKTFDWFVNQPHGLQWQQDFAAAHGKQTSVAEWGVNSNSPEFVKLALQWMADHNMVYQSYWESNAAFQGDLSSGQYKDAAAAYLDMLDKLAPAAEKGVTSAVDVALGVTDSLLTLTGNAIYGGGNALDNVLIGNAGDNALYGRAGNDKLYGGAGNDTLDGGTGADTMVGGTGNDSYYVDHAGDKVVELPGEGIDTVFSSIDYTLGANVENLSLTGAARNGIGNALDNTLTGTGGNDVFHGLDGNDVLRGYAGNDALFGGAGNDSLYGNEGDDYLDGGTGADVMEGGSGNDNYIVDNVGDIVREDYLNGQGGWDTVYASIDYTLTANVESLYLTGSAVRGTGNALANTLYGNAGDNILYGLDGDDTLRGDAGNDKLYGGSGNDMLYGDDGNDLLDGGIGMDTMAGGKGDDVYYVDNVRDVVIEKAGEGIDTVYTSVNHTLSANVENLYMTGTANLIGTGNALDNMMYGNAGNDTLYGLDGNDVIRGYAGDDRIFGGAGDDRLDGNEGNDYLDGGTGADIMDGSVGNDTYVVDNVGDVVRESYNNGLGGIDTVLSSIDYTLGANVENLTLTGSAALRGTGNALDNVIIGNIGDNILTGGAGNDTLTGGGGNDRFVFGASSGKDVVTDFGKGDVIDLAALKLPNAPAISMVGDNAVIDLGGGNTITLSHVSADHLHYTGSGFTYM
jgi:Ca2+-binding RTX toxin-like protein